MKEHRVAPPPSCWILSAWAGPITKQSVPCLILLAWEQQGAADEELFGTRDSLPVSSLFPFRSSPPPCRRQYETFSACHPLHCPGDPPLPGPCHPCWADATCQGTAERWVSQDWYEMPPLHGPKCLVGWRGSGDEWLRLTASVATLRFFVYFLAVKEPWGAYPPSAPPGAFLGTNQAM